MPRDKDDPAARIHFCARCGSTTHWFLTESAAARFGNGLMGLNMRLADEADLTGIELRFPDGRLVGQLRVRPRRGSARPRLKAGADPPLQSSSG